MNYISKQGDAQILAFKYRGKDLSLSYEYLWSPLAQKVLLITPPNIAPNTITVFGFVLHILATIIICLHLPFDSDAPTWTLLLYGFTVFTYQTLDNVDGKQSRKIKNSTPLGMIMDHGCDALGTVFLTAGMARVMCLGSATLVTWAYISVVFSFYMSAWCQYYSNGLMILGKFNGVDDGIPTIWGLAFISAIFGQDFWRIPFTIVGHTLLLNQIVCIAVIVVTFLQIYSVVFQSGDQFTKDVAGALKDLIHFLLLTVTMLLIIYKSDLLGEYVAGILVGLGFTMARTISYTLVCTVTKMKFHQFQPSVLVFTIVYSVYVLFCRGLVHPAIIVYGVAAFAVIQYFVYVVVVSNHIADLLGITIFKVFKPLQDRK